MFAACVSALGSALRWKLGLIIGGGCRGFSGRVGVGDSVQRLAKIQQTCFEICCLFLYVFIFMLFFHTCMFSVFFFKSLMTFAAFLDLFGILMHISHVFHTVTRGPGHFIFTKKCCSQELIATL